MAQGRQHGSSRCVDAPRGDQSRQLPARRAKLDLRARHRGEPAGDTHNDVDIATIVAVRAALQVLPPPQRSVLVLRYYLDLPMREVAIVLGRPEGTVRSLASSAIATLRTSGLIGTEEICDVR